MASEQVVEKVRDAAADCLKTPVDTLVHHADWGKINFDKARPDLERLFAMLGPLSVLPLEIVPENIANDIHQRIDPPRRTIEQIRLFNIEGTDNPAGQRDNICVQLREQVDSLFQILTPWIPYLAYARGDVDRNIAQLASAVAESRAMVEAGKQEIGAKKEELDSIIAAAREASASVGVAHFTVDFSNEASNRETSAGHWLVATAVMGGLSAIAAVVLMFVGIPEGASTAVVVNRVVSKVVLLTLLLGATVWCGRIYKAIMHQAITNRHRANSLKTFQAFTKAATDDTSRNAVLLETTRSIFALAPSGYLDGGDSSSDGGTKVVEIVKGAAQAVGSGKAA